MCEGKKTFLRLISDNRSSGTATNPKFILNRTIEGIKSYQIKQFMIDISNISSKFMNINSPELSGIIEDNLQGSYNSVTQTIMSVDTGVNVINIINTFENPKYQCPKSRLNTITLDFQNEGCTGSVDGLTTQKWNMLIEFTH